MYPTLEAARAAHRNFLPHLRAAHHYVQLPSGRWCATLGIPGPMHDARLEPVGARVWHMIHTGPFPGVKP